MAEGLVSTRLYSGTPVFTALGVTTVDGGFAAELVFQQAAIDDPVIEVEHHTQAGVVLCTIRNPGIPHVGFLVGPPVGKDNHYFVSEEK